MNFGKKMVLVDYDEAKKCGLNSKGCHDVFDIKGSKMISSIHDSSTDPKTAFNKKSEEILHQSYLSDDEKVQQFNNLLTQYLSHTESEKIRKKRELEETGAIVKKILATESPGSEEPPKQFKAHKSQLFLMNSLPSEAQKIRFEDNINPVNFPEYSGQSVNRKRPELPQSPAGTSQNNTVLGQVLLLNEKLKILEAKLTPKPNNSTDKKKALEKIVPMEISFSADTPRGPRKAIKRKLITDSTPKPSRKTNRKNPHPRGHEVIKKWQTKSRMELMELH
ncbi:unnamed protein product [Chironomus riparius]|uniref:Uncharacterized protein n=1 Tax=Chironomus riparius TaxID=315576 RepID=A0A9N9RR46_9DIPT|nr:unnamed protein product [Chironomus riparius]